MAKEWTDEEVQALISDSVKIVAEDRERAQYQALHERFGAKPEDSKDDGKTPPPKKDDKPEDPKPKKKSLWWGETDDE